MVDAFLYRDDFFRPLDDNGFAAKSNPRSINECTPAPRIANSQRPQKKSSATTNSLTYTAAKIESLKDSRRVPRCGRANGGCDASSCADTKDATCRRERVHIEKELISFYLLYGFLNDLIR
jgi:hypothetical protein